MFEIAFVTCAKLADLDPDDRLVIEPLTALGCNVTPAVWDDARVDWDRFHLSVIRSTWDYTERLDAFLRWTRSVPRLLNPPDIVEWNTDKRYLADLAAAGLSVTPTTWISDGDSVELPTEGEYVFKPSVGAGSLGAARFQLGDEDARSRAVLHAEGLLAAGHTVMVQPFADAIEDHGETGVILIDGRFSHAIRKGVMLGPYGPEEVEGLYREETIDARAPTAMEVELAHGAVAAAPTGDRPLLYARIDMVPGADGRPMVMELELTEPSLFMATAPGSEMRFAQAIAAHARRKSATEQ